MTNPCKVCIVNPMCNKPCHSFVGYIKCSITPSYRERVYVWLATKIKRKQAKLDTVRRVVRLINSKGEYIWDDLE